MVSNETLSFSLIEKSIISISFFIVIFDTGNKIDKINIMNKKVTLELVGLDGNAYSVMGAFEKQARREKWSKEKINSVLAEAMSGDYNHLLATIMDHCQSPEE